MNAAGDISATHGVLGDPEGEVGQWNIGRRLAAPRPAGHVVPGVDGPTCPDQRVAAPQVQAEPGRGQALRHGCEPQRDLGELDRGRVQVDAVHVVQREVGLDALQLGLELLRRDLFAQLLLAAGQVLLGELPDRLDRERARPERRLTDRQAEDFLGRGGGAVLVE